MQGHCVSRPSICHPDLGLPAERVEKDLTVFSSNSERMEQAVELMQETLAADRRKKEKRPRRSHSRLSQLTLKPLPVSPVLEQGLKLQLQRHSLLNRL